MATNCATFKNEIPSSAEKGVSFDTKRANNSITSSISSRTTLLDAANFHPSTALRVDTRGMSMVRCSTPLVTQIFHEDGSLAYISTRTKVLSGTAILSNPRQGDLISTTYSTLLRAPEIRFLQGQEGSDAVVMHGRCFTRSRSFTTPDGRAFEWSYAQLKDGNKKRVNIIALREQGTERILAQLVRGEGTRTEGTSKWGSGNGGQLVLAEAATSYVDEALIVATCLVMLKKEIDRAKSSSVVIVV